MRLHVVSGSAKRPVSAPLEMGRCLFPFFSSAFDLSPTAESIPLWSSRRWADSFQKPFLFFFFFKPGSFFLGVSDRWQKTEAPRILPCWKLGHSEVRVGNCSHHTLYLESSFFFKKSSPDKHLACLLIAFSSFHKCKFSRKTSTDSKVYQAVQEQSPPHPHLPQQLPNQLLNTGFSFLASLTYLRDVKAIVFALSFEKKKSVLFLGVMTGFYSDLLVLLCTVSTFL